MASSGGAVRSSSGPSRDYVRDPPHLYALCIVALCRADVGAGLQVIADQYVSGQQSLEFAFLPKGKQVLEVLCLSKLAFFGGMLEADTGFFNVAMIETPPEFEALGASSFRGPAHFVFSPQGRAVWLLMQHLLELSSELANLEEVSKREAHQRSC